MTTSTVSTSIRRAHQGDIAVAGQVMADAFFDDPVFRWCMPDDDRRAGILPAFFSLVAATLLPYDEVHVTGDGAGAAFWVPPGQPSVPAAEAPAFEERLAELLTDAEAERTFAVVELLESNHPHDHHDYLWFLGVRAGRQGQGIGSALLNWMLERTDAGGHAAYLEATSEGNRRLYRRHGFEVVKELSVADCPSLWAMWRPAR
jgi:ribosomal protein S18 acetylase RimI-like enzyme